MTTAERAALLEALAVHPEIKQRFPQFWRVKRMDAGTLRKLATGIGVDVQALRRRVQRPRTRATRQAPRAKPDAPFKGTFGFTLNVEAFGLNTPRRARVVWEYTPEWPHHPPKGGLRIDAGEDCAFFVEVETVAQEGTIERHDGTEEPVMVHEWQRLVLWGAGLVGEDVVGHIFERIDADARAQNRARKTARRRLGC